MLTRPGEEFRVLGMIAWHLRRSAGRTGGSAGDFRTVLTADLALKTGAPPLATMQLLVARLCLGL